MSEKIRDRCKLKHKWVYSEPSLTTDGDAHKFCKKTCEKCGEQRLKKFLSYKWYIIK